MTLSIIALSLPSGASGSHGLRKVRKMIELGIAARIVGIKRRTLANACWRGILRATKRGHRYFVTRADLDAYEERFKGPCVKVRHVYAERFHAGESPESIAHDQSVKLHSVYRALNREGIWIRPRNKVAA